MHKQLFGCVSRPAKTVAMKQEVSRKEMGPTLITSNWVTILTQNQFGREFS